MKQINYSANTVINKYFHAMTGVSVYHGFSAFLQSGAGGSVSTLRENFNRGGLVLAKAALYSYEHLNSSDILKNIGAVCNCTNEEFLAEFEKYSSETLAADPRLLSHIPHACAYPTAAELIGFIIGSNRRRFYKNLINYIPTMEKSFDNYTEAMMVNLSVYYKHQLAGFHRFQVRFYDLRDQLIEKRNFDSFDEACDFGDERLVNGMNISRYIIRTNSLFSGEWLICRAVGNKPVSDHIINEPAEWLVTFYDSSDRMQQSYSDKKLILPEFISGMRRRLDSQYYVMSCRAGEEKLFKVQYFSAYWYIKDNILTEIIKSAAEYGQANREELYRGMLAEDAKESERMIGAGYIADEEIKL